MEKTVIRADYNIACELMDSFYALYMAIVEGMGGNPNDLDAVKYFKNFKYFAAFPLLTFLAIYAIL